MSRLVAGLLLALVLPTMVEDPPKDDMTPFQGTWNLIEGHVGEKPFLQPGDTYAWIIEKDKTTTLRNGVLAQGSMTMKLDSKANPNTASQYGHTPLRYAV